MGVGGGAGGGQSILKETLCAASFLRKLMGQRCEKGEMLTGWVMYTGLMASSLKAAPGGTNPG